MEKQREQLEQHAMKLFMGFDCGIMDCEASINQTSATILLTIDLTDEHMRIGIEPTLRFTGENIEVTKGKINDFVEQKRIMLAEKFPQMKSP